MPVAGPFLTPVVPLLSTHQWLAVLVDNGLEIAYAVGLEWHEALDAPFATSSAAIDLAMVVSRTNILPGAVHDAAAIP